MATTSTGVGGRGARGGERLNVNAAVALIAVEKGVSWQKLPAADKARARALVGRLREAQHGRWSA